MGLPDHCFCTVWNYLNLYPEVVAEARIEEFTIDEGHGRAVTQPDDQSRQPGLTADSAVDPVCSQAGRHDAGSDLRPQRLFPAGGCHRRHPQQARGQTHGLGLWVNVDSRGKT